MSMWIDKNKSNELKTVYVMDYIDPLTNKRKYASATVKGKATKRQYNDTLLLLQKKIAKKLDMPLHNESRTFESVAIEWLEEYQHEVKYSTYHNTKMLIKSIYKLIPNDIKVDRINGPFIQKLLNHEYYKRNVSYSHVSRLKTIITHVLKYAKKYGYATDISYLQDISIKKKPKTHDELQTVNNKFLNKHELTSVLKEIYAKNKRYGMLCEFMALTGVRIGEAVAIRTQDIDFNNCSVAITGTISLVSKKGNYERTTPKNAASYRTISINYKCVEILKTLIIENKKARLLSRSYKDKDYIFTTRTGNIIRFYQLNAFLTNIQKKIQLDKHLTSHIFRHTHISILTELGLPLKSIMQRVGHTNPNTTLKIYTHVTDEMTKELNSKLNDFKLEIS